MFFVPPADPTAPRSVALGNTYAALSELHHFQSKKSPGGPNTVMAFDKHRSTPISDGEPAVRPRLGVLQLPRGSDPAKVAAGRGDRAGLPAPCSTNYSPRPGGWPTKGGTCTGMRTRRAAPIVPDLRPVPPRAGHVQKCWLAATRRFAQRQIQQLDRRRTRAHHAGAHRRVTGWSDSGRSGSSSYEAMSASGSGGTARATLRGGTGPKVFDAFVDPLRTPHSVGRAGWMRTSACAVLDQLLKLVGKPDPDARTLRMALSWPLAQRDSSMNW